MAMPDLKALEDHLQQMELDLKMQFDHDAMQLGTSDARVILDKARQAAEDARRQVESQITNFRNQGPNPVFEFQDKFPIGPWFALLGPAGLPPDIVATMNKIMVAVVDTRNPCLDFFQAGIMDFSPSVACAAPAVNFDPVSQFTNQPGPYGITLNVFASGTTPFTYQWQKETSPDTWTDMSDDNCGIFNPALFDAIGTQDREPRGDPAAERVSDQVAVPPDHFVDELAPQRREFRDRVDALERPGTIETRGDRREDRVGPCKSLLR